MGNKLTMKTSRHRRNKKIKEIKMEQAVKGLAARYKVTSLKMKETWGKVR